MPIPTPDRASPPWRYRLLVGALSPLIIGYTLWRAYKDGGMPYLKQRLGFYPASSAKTESTAAQAYSSENSTPVDSFSADLWVHAASVGEVFTVLPLLKAWLDNNKHKQVLVTTGTPTGAVVLQQQNLPGVRHQYLPVDFSTACTRFVAQIQARQAWIVETEIWPWLYAHCERQNIKLTIVNGRLSERTSTQANGILASSYRCALRSVNVLARSEKDHERFVALGAQPPNIQVAGNLKYSGQPTPLNAPPLLDAPYVVAASTHSDEELLIAIAWQTHNESTAQLVIVPRHPERGDDISKQIKAQGISVAQRSRSDAPGNQSTVYLADTLGELQAWYEHAQGAFVGGSLIKRGGHNMLEPARYACPAIVGTNTTNFDDMMELLSSQSAIAIAQDEYEVVSFLSKAASGDTDVRSMGQRAQQTAIDAQGTLARYLDLLK